MEKHSKAFVIDNGSGYLKAGIAVLDAPSLEIPSVVAQPTKSNWKSALLPPLEVGYKALKLKNIDGTLQNPFLPANYDTNWEGKLALWKHAFREMVLEPREWCLLLTEPIGNSNRNREKIGELVFEKLSCPGLCLEIAQLLAMYAVERKNGIVVDCGYSKSVVAPIIDGELEKYAVEKFDVCGFALTCFLQKIVSKFWKNEKESYRIAEQIKKKECYVSNVPIQQKLLIWELSRDKTFEYRLPDGKILRLGIELTACPESLFYPGILSKKLKLKESDHHYEYFGIHEVIARAINKCHEDYKEKLCKNIILCGGSTRFRGLDRRLEDELNRIMFNNMKIVKVIQKRKANWLPWIGGSLLASHSLFPKRCVFKNEYQEFGPNIVCTFFRSTCV